MTLRSVAGTAPGGPASFSQLTLSSTNTGTVGNVTINQPSGRVNIAAAAASVVITNNLATPASRCFVNIASSTVDATMTSVQADCSVSGQITIRGNGAATTQRAIDFLLVN